MFDERLFRSIFFTYDHHAGPKSNEVLAGDSVTLQMGGEHILVGNVIPTTMGHFKAIVYGFEPGVTSQEIEFDEAHIFGCQKRA